MSKLEKFKEKIKLMQEFDELFNKLEQIYPSSSCFSRTVDDCFRLKDDYVDYVAKEFNISVEDLCWFIFETEYGTIPTMYDSDSGESVLVDSIESFYEWVCG